MLSTIALVLSRCEPQCDNPCHELNGDVVSECGGCIVEQCRRGSPSFAATPSGRAPFWDPLSDWDDPSVVVQLSSQGEANAPIPANSEIEPCGMVNACPSLAQRGECDQHPDEMLRHCPKACGFSEDHAVSTCPAEPSQSLDATRSFVGRCPSTEELDRIMAARCEDLEDVGRLKDRGFVVVRNAADPAELAEMRHFVAGLPMPDRVLCGASDVQVWQHACQ